MKIWITNHYATPPSKGGIVRHHYFWKYMTEKGHDVKIITSSKIHNTEENVITDGIFSKVLLMDGVPYTYLRCSNYKGNGIKRMYSFLEFPIKLYKFCRQNIKEEKPDVIYASSPEMFSLLASVIFAKRHDITVVAEVRDLWPESIVAVAGYSRKNPIIKILYYVEKWIYKNADGLIFTMEGGRQYIADQKWESQINADKIYHINNGVDLEEFNNNKSIYKFADEDLDAPNTYKIIYTGSVRKANGMERVVEVSEYIEKHLGMPDYKFLIYGNGNCVEELKRLCEQKEIHNVEFKGFVPKCKIPYILSKADVLLVNYPQIEAANDVFRYGQSHNKLFEYLAAQVPILYAQPANYNIIEKYNCGIVLERNAGTATYAKAIISLCSMKLNEKEKMKQNCKAALTDYDFRYLTENLMIALEESYERHRN